MNSEKTVLFIEDDPDQQKMYKFAFRETNIRFLQASSGEEGVKVAEETKPDVILLDLLMNGIGGVETLRLIKESAVVPKTTPVIIFTNYTKEEVLKKAEALGASEIIIKTDVLPRELVERIQTKYLR